MEKLSDAEQVRALAVQAVARLHAGHAHLMDKKELFELAQEWAAYIRIGRVPR